MEECYFNRNNTPPRYVTRFINSANGTKSCKAYYLIGSVNWLALNCQERKMVRGITLNFIFQVLPSKEY